MMSLRILAVLLAMLAPAYAHDIKGPNGGRIRDAGSLHVELVSKGNSVEVYVTDQSAKPIDTNAMKGLAILLASGKSQRVELGQAGGNKLSGAAAVGLPAAPKGVIQIMLPDGKTAQAKF